MENNLPTIHDFLLKNRVTEAAELYNKSAHMNPDALTSVPSGTVLKINISVFVGSVCYVK